MNPEQDTLRHHIKMAKNGNQTAFRYLLDRFWNEVYSFQLKRTKNEYEAEEVTIQTFSKAFDKIGTYKEKYKFTTWLLTISKNLHLDLIRSKEPDVAQITHEKAKRIPDDAPTAEDKLITEQNLSTLLRDIKQLKPHYQEVINLRYFHEMSYKEIAEKMGEPINNIKVKLLRAKKLLAEVIVAN